MTNNGFVCLKTKKLSFFYISINYALLFKKKRIQSSEGKLIFWNAFDKSLLFGFSGEMINNRKKNDLDF
jgi:hypothetical protein